MLSQAGAYYDPDTKKFYIVLVPDEASMLDIMSAHELTHALDDQYFDLGAYTGDPKHELTNDEQQARRMVGEGDATLVMLAYQAKVAAHEDIFDPRNRRMERAIVDTFASLEPETLAQSTAPLAPGAIKDSLDAMASIPPFILEPLFGAYTKGAAGVAAVRDRGGWEAVCDLYEHPPESTEQVLHPVEKLIGKRDHPVWLAFPPFELPGYGKALTPIDHDVIGELTMAVYFKIWGDRTPAAEVEGWGGDLYTAFAREGEVVGCWLTTWDTSKDARRFVRAYAATLPVRFPGERTWSGKKGAKGVSHPGGTVTAVVYPGHTDRDAYIVDGARAPDADAFLDWMHHRIVWVTPTAEGRTAAWPSLATIWSSGAGSQG